MKRPIKQYVISSLLALCLLAGAMLPATAITYNGIAGNGTNGIYIDIYSHPYTTYANKAYGQYAYTDLGCAWFASARACQLTGIDTPIWSGQSWYDSAYAYYGYTRGATPQAKALVCYTNHVAVVESVNGNSITISEGGNTSSGANDYCIIQTLSREQVESARGGAFLGYVYLGVGGSGGSSAVDLGTDFYGYIYSDYANMVLTTNTDGNWGNVFISPYRATKRQLWRFVRNGDGSYVIYSAYGNCCLDVADASKENGANLTANRPSGHPAQSFYILQGPDSYIFQTALCSTVIDIAGDYGPVDGTNVAMWSYWGGDNQHFTVYKVPGNYPPLMQYGDITLDGLVDASDALLALQHSVNLTHLDYTYLETADVNNDDVINATDALMILQKSVGLIPSFPAQSQ